MNASTSRWSKWWPTGLTIGLILALLSGTALGQAQQRPAVRRPFMLRPGATRATAPKRADTSESAASKPDASTTPDAAEASDSPASTQPASGPADAESPFSPEERDQLKATYNALSDVEKAEMRAYYEDLDIDLTAALGIRAAAAPRSTRSLADAVRTLDFTRKPENILAARSKLGFAPSVMPDLSNGDALAAWLHMNVMAGEWKALTDLLPLLAEDEATAVYSQILRSTNQGTAGLLPEEVLTLGDACPGEMADWQLEVLAGMLQKSAESYGKELFLERIKAGTRLFGDGDEAKRARTAQLLTKAGLVREAHAYLTSLDDARQQKNALVMLAHAMYALAMAGEGTNQQERAQANQAWDIFCTVSLMPGADAELRKDAARRAIDMFTRVPPSRATEWLSQAFADPSLGPAALEIVALQAIGLRNKKLDAAKRAESIATMKAAVDTLLAQPDRDAQTLRVPLRMLTTALADAVDETVREKANLRGVAAETQMLFRAMPDERWLAAIEPSVAIRGYHAAVAIATIADQTDIALDVLKKAVKRFPEGAPALADEFLGLWVKRLHPGGVNIDEDSPFFFYARQRVPAAPLTRGRQRRNLDRLNQLITLLDEAGVSARRLPNITTAFRACYARTEVFDRAQVVRVFGPIEEMPAVTASALATTMRAGLSGDWQNREIQQSYGMVRSKTEVEQLVETGYELAIELADRAVAQEPNSWRHAILKAGLNYDRVQYTRARQQQDFATYNEYRRQAFSAFEQAAQQYADLVVKGLEKDDPGVYLAWFSALLDIGQPTDDEENASTAEAQAAAATEQIDRISKAMSSLPPEISDRQIGGFARAVIDALSNVPPEKKPSIVRSAMRIVGDHPAGAPLRDLYELYEDLLKNEIKLRIAVDGPDRVAAKQVFGAVLTLRFTNSVDRETGGFDKYLYQDSYERIGTQYRMINYQALMRTGIETALGQYFTVESIGFFEPLTPSREVMEDGQLGWQEKPMAYVVLKAKDASVDRLPQLTFDMHFNDTSGPVTLPILSNSPLIDATATTAAPRPMKDLEVTQTVDLRRLLDGTKDRAVTLEITAKAEGVIPELRELMEGLDSALPGYAIADDGIETRPLNVVQAEGSGTRRSALMFARSSSQDKKDYATADENGIFRLNVERSWLVTFKPASGSVGGVFTLPKLKAGLDGQLTSRRYADMDIVDVKDPTIPINRPWRTALAVGLIVAVAVVGGLVAWRLMKRSGPATSEAGGIALPGRITPLSTIATLQRMSHQIPTLTPDQRRALAKEIESLQFACFGPSNGNGNGNGHQKPDESAMRELLERWAKAH